MSEKIFSPDVLQIEAGSRRVNLPKLEALTRLAYPLSRFDRRLASASAEQISLLTAIDSY